jgi:hypothetical protein
MGEQVRAASVFANGRKVGQFTGGQFQVLSGDEPNFGDNNGVVVYSDGIIQSMLDMKTYEPVDGIDFDIEGALLAKQDLPMTISLISGKIHQMTMRPLECTWDTEWKSGKLDGNYKFGGSAPTRQ